MTLALRLADQGFDVTIVEATERVGGLVSPIKIGNYTWDRFYHVILKSDSNLLDLLERLNLVDRINWKQTRTGFFNNGHLYSMSNIMEFLTFPPLTLLDKIRLGLTIFYASKIRSWKRLEGILVTNWLKHFSGERTFNKIWLPLLKSKLGEYYKITSASFIWAAISRMYLARRTGLKQEMFGYVDGGYSTILGRFQSALHDVGVRILCERPVTKIMDSKTHAKVETGLGEPGEFNDVISTIPCNHLAEICPQLSHEEKRRLGGVIYEGVICACLILKKPLAEYYITNITDGWLPFTAVIEMTAVVDEENFEGNSLVYLPRYLTQEDLFWKKSDDEIQDEFLKALEVMYPSFSRSDVVAFRIIRADEVLPITTLHYSSELLPPTRTSLDHVFVVNSAQIANGTMNVNEIIGLANTKAMEIVNLVGGSRLEV